MAKPRQSASSTRQRVSPTPEILDEIFSRLEAGESLSGICYSEPERFPRPSTITDLCAANAEVSARYARARNAGLDRLAEQSLSVASDKHRDPNCRRVELDAIKWFTSKLRPDKYGDASKLELTGANGGPIQVQAERLQKLTTEELELLASMQQKVIA